MNASQLYVGEHYAFTPNPTRGRITLGAKRVRLRSTEKRKGRLDTNATTYAHITVVETGRELTVRARCLLDFWVEYKRETDMLEREAREAETNRHRENVRNAMIATSISWSFREKTGIDLTGALKYNPHKETVIMPAKEILDWLEITDAVIEDAVDRHIQGGINAD